MDNNVSLIVIIGIPLLIIVWVVATYNRLVNLRNLIPESWSNIDTELRRRYDLIPNLVNVVKGYAQHEQSIMNAVAEARSKAVAATGTPEEQAAEENVLVHSLKSLIAISEAYPNLKADGQFLRLQQELINTEDRIQAARRFYNGNVRDLNSLIQMFPSNIIAGMGGFKEAEYFQIDEVFISQPVPVGFTPGNN